jgi:hypothetical protein
LPRNVLGLSSGCLEKNVLDSCCIFSEEGVYPELTGIKTSQVDNSTDALMLLIASYPSMEKIKEKNLFSLFFLCGFL